MKSPIKRFFDQSYLGREKQLSVQLQISPRYVYQTFLDSANNVFVGYQEFYLGEHDSWDAAYDDLELVLAKNISSEINISVGLINSLFTLVPSSLFSSEAALDYLKLNHEIVDENQLTIHENQIESVESTLVFAFPKRLKQMLLQQFAACHILHYSSPLLEFSGLENKTGKESFKIHIQYDHFDIVYLNHGKLIFFNRFNYQTVEDFIYYLLYVVEQLHLDREKVELEVFGEFEKQSAIYEMLFKYIRNIQVRERTPNMKYSAVLSELPKHYYFNLFNQYLCE